MPYFLVPFIAWTVSGCLKFLINRIRYGEEARNHMGNGGFPSTHTATVSSITFLLGLSQGWLSPIFGLAVTFLFIVIIDATGLRIAVGKQAAAVNKMNEGTDSYKILREKMGHTRIEIIGGLIVGLAVSIVFYWLFSSWGWSK